MSQRKPRVLFTAAWVTVALFVVSPWLAVLLAGILSAASLLKGFIG